MAYWLDDGFDTWPEIARAGTPAAGLYSRCGAWLARNLSNGRIADAVVPIEVVRMYGTVEWAQRLVDVCLWAVEGDGYRDLRHFDLNPTAEKAQALRQKRSAAGRKGGLASGRTRASKQNRTKHEANAEANRPQLLEPLPPPSTKGEGERARADAGRSALPQTQPVPHGPNGKPNFDVIERAAATGTHRSELIAAARRAPIAKRPPPERSPPRDALAELRALTEVPDSLVTEPETP